MARTSQASQDLDPLVGLDEASLGSDDALVVGLEVLMPHDSPPRSVSMNNPGRGGNKRPPVPTRIEVTEIAPNGLLVKADNATKREASRHTEATMKKYPIVDQARVEAIQRKTQERRVPPPHSYQRMPDEDTNDVLGTALIFGGFALLGISLYFLMRKPGVVADVAAVAATP